MYVNANNSCLAQPNAKKQKKNKNILQPKKKRSITIYTHTTIESLQHLWPLSWSGTGDGENGCFNSILGSILGKVVGGVGGVANTASIPGEEFLQRFEK